MRLILKNPETLSTEFYEIKDKKERIITLLEKKGISPLIYSVISNGKNLSLNSELKDYENSIIEFRIILKGGKGGFGTLLKTQPARKKLTNNFDACRDLSGRRIGHVNQEKLNKEWKQKKKNESKIINKYNNGGKIEDVEYYLKKDKNIDIVKENKKFLREQENIDKMINKTFKYLKKKRERINCENKDNKNYKENNNFFSVKEINNNVKEEFNSKEKLLELLLD